MTTESQAPVVLFDGACRLCSAWVRFILTVDHEAVFRLAAMQSDAGQGLLQRWAFPLHRYDTIVVIADGLAYTQSDAVLRILVALPRPWRWLAITRHLPVTWRDYLYRSIAKHRYRWFGRRRVCALLTASDRRRFLSTQEI